MSDMKLYLDKSEEFIYKALQQAYFNNKSKPVGAGLVRTAASTLPGTVPSAPNEGWSVLSFEDRVVRVLNRLVKKGRAEAVTEIKTMQRYGQGIKSVSATGRLYYKRPTTTPIGSYQQTITKYIPI